MHEKNVTNTEDRADRSKENGMFNRHQRRAIAASVRKAERKNNWGEWESITDQAKRTKDVPPGLTSVFKNNIFIVQVFDYSDVTKLMIRRNDGQPIRDWSALQRVKNEISGPSKVAVEIYPRQSALVDVANIYWLWVLPDGVDLPFVPRV